MNILCLFCRVHSKLRSVVNVTRIIETFSVDISLQTPILVGPWQMAEWMGEGDWVIRQGEKKGWWLGCQQSALKLIGASLAHSTGPRFSPQNELIQVKVSAKSCYLQCCQHVWICYSFQKLLEGGHSVIFSIHRMIYWTWKYIFPMCKTLLFLITVIRVLAVK